MLNMKEYHTTNHTTQNLHPLLTTQSQLHTTHLSQLPTTHSPNQHHIIPNLLPTIQLLFTSHLQLLTISKFF